MKSKLVIIGAGGHGKVIADIALLNGYRDIAFLDDNARIRQCADFPVIGKVCDAVKIDSDKFVAIGNADIRKKIMDENRQVVTLIHPNAVIARRTVIEYGTVVMPGVVVNTETKIGRGCIINTGATVDHECTVGDFAHVAVGSHIAGGVKIGDNTWIGAGTVISNNVRICSNCIIGAGSVVIHDIDNPGIYVGVPAKKIK